MRRRERARLRRFAGTAAAVALAGLLVLALASPTLAKQKSSATTRGSTIGLASGASATLSASCKGKTHVTGGGFGVSPTFTPPSSGLRSWSTASNPVGAKTWSASSAAFTNPNASGSFTTFARCESNALGRLAVRASGSATLAPGEFRTFTLQCPKGTHVISGGYSGDGPTDVGHANGWRIDVLQSQRTSSREWTLAAYDRSSQPPSPAGANFTGYVVCEFNQKGVRVTHATSSAPLAQDTSAVASPSCPKKQHVVSSGFVISPLPSAVGSSIPVVAMDENQPSGSRGWHVEVHPWTTAVLPPGESLVATAYCKKDSTPKK